MKPKQLSLLTTNRFMPLFLTQFLGALNDNIFKNALMILITYRIAKLAGGNAQILVTLAAGIFIFPFFLFSATAGQLADKLEKSRLISIIKFIEMILMARSAIGFYSQNLPLLLGVLFALGTHAAFFGPLKYALLPEHLHEGELIAGNGLIEAGTFIAILIGTIIGGAFILYPHGDVIIATITLVVAAMGWITSIYIPKSSQQPQVKITCNFINETIKLISYSKHQKDLFICILGISWFWLIGAIFLSEFPVLAKDTLHAQQSIVTVFLAIFSIGLAVGSLACNKLLKGKIHATYVPLGALGITIFTLDFYFAAQHIHLITSASLINLFQFLHSLTSWRLLIDLLFIAICGGIYTVPLYTILQNRSTKEHCARMIASNNILNALFMVIAALVTMILVKLKFSVPEIFLTLAIANSVVAIWICKLLPDGLVKGFFYVVLKFKNNS